MRKMIILVACLALSACAPTLPLPTPSPLPARRIELTPFLTLTPVLSATLAPNLPTATPLPTPTITPRTHTVSLGEDMSGIALRYRVSLDALKTANPSANPRLIFVGQVLVIPGATPIPGTTQPSATAAKILFDTPRCLRDEAGGLWCFTTVRNTQTTPVESVTLRIRLVDGQGKQIASYVTSTALNLLAAGKTLPAGVYFAAPLPQSVQVGAELLSVLPVMDEATRYLPIKLQDQRVQIAVDRQSVDVSGTLALLKSPPEAKQVGVAVAAYAADGSLVGLRRWESLSALGAQTLNYKLTIYAVRGNIDRVEVMAEARP